MTDSVVDCPYCGEAEQLPQFMIDHGLKTNIKYSAQCSHCRSKYVYSVEYRLTSEKADCANDEGNNNHAWEKRHPKCGSPYWRCELCKSQTLENPAKQKTN